jgi:hypothetical protein
MDHNNCKVCGGVADKQCPCGARYCSRQCQRVDRPAHKSDCKKALTSAAASANASAKASAVASADASADASVNASAEGFIHVNFINGICTMATLSMRQERIADKYRSTDGPHWLQAWARNTDVNLDRFKDQLNWPQAWARSTAATQQRINDLCALPQVYNAMTQVPTLKPGSNPLNTLISHELGQQVVQDATVRMLPGICIVTHERGSSNDEFSELYERNGNELGNYICSLKNVTYVVPLLWLGPYWVAIVYCNYGNPLIIHICEHNCEGVIHTRLELTFTELPTTSNINNINKYYNYYFSKKLVYVFGAYTCALPSNLAGYLFLGIENEGKASIITIPIVIKTKDSITIQTPVNESLPEVELRVEPTVDVGAMLVEPIPFINKPLGMTGIVGTFNLLVVSDKIHKFHYLPGSPISYTGFLNPGRTIYSHCNMAACITNKGAIRVSINYGYYLYEGWFKNSTKNIHVEVNLIDVEVNPFHVEWNRIQYRNVICNVAEGSIALS